MTVGVNWHHRHHLPLYPLLLTLVIILHAFAFNSCFASCDFSLTNKNKLYNYNLASPSPKFPHGVLSEDGFYKVAANGTVLWFQLCDSMIFNHDPPSCAACTGCGTPSRCGMGCSALVSNNIEGYHVCTAIGLASTMNISVLDEKSPNAGVIVKMTSNTGKGCSLSVFLICDSDGVQGPQTLEKTESCHYSTQLRHPNGCATIEHVHGKGLGWFGTFITIILCLFGAYFLAGAVYRYFYLHIRGIDVIPNLEFWASIPHRTMSLYTSTVQRFRRPSENFRSSYSPVDF